MRVEIAQMADFSSWLELAAEVEPLFGAMVNEPKFRNSLQSCIRRSAALCVREGDGPPGTPLLGGLLFSARPPQYRIGWLAVASRSRRRGVATALVRHAIGLVQPPGEVIVHTFREDNEEGKAARLFYERMGFHAAEMATGPNDIPVQVFRRVLP